MKHVQSSAWISLFILILIPLSWVAQFVFNNLMINSLVAKFGTEVLANISTLQILFLSIPIGQLVTLATIVIPAIFLRKAVREGTTNMTLPVGKNAVDLKGSEK